MKQTFAVLMIKMLVLSVLIIGTPDTAYAQPEGALKGIEITPYAGYMWGGKQRYYNGEFKIDGAFTYGVMLSYSPRPGTWVEFAYSGAQTQGRTILGGEVGVEEDFDIGVNYFLIQGRQIWRTGAEDIRPFGIMGLGAAYYNGQSDNSEGDVWSFAMSFGLGLIYDVSDRIGIRIQSRLLMPLTFGGIGFGCGIGTGGGGCGGGVSTYATMLQGDVGGGLVFRF